MQIGYTGHYMRFRYTYSDHSLDFNIMDYKGSVQFKSKFMKFMFFASENVPWVLNFSWPRTYRNSFEKFKILFRKGEGGPGTFDIERTCRELGEWCNDPAGVSGRLDCSHCDSYDRLNNKCPECIRGTFIPFWYELSCWILGVVKISYKSNFKYYRWAWVWIKIQHSWW